MQMIIQVIKKLAVWLGYIILAITAVVVVIVISEDDTDAQRVSTPIKPPVDEVLSFQTVASNPGCKSKDELLFMCSFIEKIPASISSVYICRKDRDLVLNIYRSFHNDLTSLESTIEDSFVPWSGVGKGIGASFDFKEQGTDVTVSWGVDDKTSSGSNPSASVNGAFDGFGACNDIQHYPGFYFVEDLK
ncbi:hypothetical protein OAB29_00530 [Oceanospirillaceae bacterium]|nr:hypothetical protein [Oceanospirillaceae bacterium]